MLQKEQQPKYSRSDFLKSLGLITAMTGLQGCSRIIGLPENPKGIDFYSQFLLDELKIYLTGQSDMLSEMEPFTDLSWFKDNPDVIYGIKQVSSEKVDIGHVNVQTTKKERVYFKILWNSDKLTEFLPDDAIRYFETKILVHEIAHILFFLAQWNNIKIKGLTGKELTESFEKEINNPDFRRQNEFFSDWTSELYIYTLSRDPEILPAISDTFYLNPENQQYDVLKTLNWFVENNLDWRSSEYQWFFERKLFTDIQQINVIYEEIGNPQRPYSDLNIRDSQISGNFKNFLLSPNGGNLKRIEGVISADTRDLFETNPQIRDYFK